MVASDRLENISHQLGPAVIHIELVDLSAAVIAGVKSLPIVSGTWRTGNTLLVQVNTYGDIRAQVSQAVTSAGGVIVGMSQKNANLEDIFIQLVTKDQGGKPQ
jgi:hypothetical protein